MHSHDLYFVRPPGCSCAIYLAQHIKSLRTSRSRGSRPVHSSKNKLHTERTNKHTKLRSDQSRSSTNRICTLPSMYPQTKPMCKPPGQSATSYACRCDNCLADQPDTERHRYRKHFEPGLSFRHLPIHRKAIRNRSSSATMPKCQREKLTSQESQ